MAAAANSTPRGCGPDVDPLYHRLCDLDAAWGVAVEAVAAAGLVSSFVLLVALLASVPFVREQHRRRAVPLQAGLLVGTAGLFCLSFAFVVGRDFSTCAARRFLFGVLFAGCFACQLVHCLQLRLLARGGAGPRALPLLLGALALWLVEVVVNAEWLIITVVRHPLGPLPTTGGATEQRTAAAAVPCNIANQDFVMALIYVMVLMVAALLASLAGVAGGRRECRVQAALVLTSVLVSVAIWATWITMFVYGTGALGRPAWDDPTLAIALAANGWAFLLCYTIPGVCCLGGDEEQDQQGLGEELYASRGVGYENILKEHSAQNLFLENKAFSMDEHSQGEGSAGGWGAVSKRKQMWFFSFNVHILSEPKPIQSLCEGLRLIFFFFLILLSLYHL